LALWPITNVNIGAFSGKTIVKPLRESMGEVLTALDNVDLDLGFISLQAPKGEEGELKTAQCYINIDLMRHL
jgi:hypothetical protein